MKAGWSLNSCLCSRPDASANSPSWVLHPAPTARRNALVWFAPIARYRTRSGSRLGMRCPDRCASSSLSPNAVCSSAEPSGGASLSLYISLSLSLPSLSLSRSVSLSLSLYLCAMHRLYRRRVRRLAPGEASLPNVAAVLVHLVNAHQRAAAILGVNRNCSALPPIRARGGGERLVWAPSCSSTRPRASARTYMHTLYG